MKCLFFFLTFSFEFLAAQPTTCTTTSTAGLVRHEGLAERAGDVLFNCTGQPGAKLTVNLSVQMNATVTNRLSTGNTVTGTVLTTDSGSGPQAVMIQPVLLTANTLVWQGVPLTFSPQGKLTIDIGDIRVNASGIPRASRLSRCSVGT